MNEISELKSKVLHLYKDTLEMKAKYIRRTGSPGNYKYVYADGSSKGGSSKKDASNDKKESSSFSKNNNNVKKEGKKLLNSDSERKRDDGGYLITLSEMIGDNDYKSAKSMFNSGDTYIREEFIDLFTNNMKDKDAVKFLEKNLDIDFL